MSGINNSIALINSVLKAAEKIIILYSDDKDVRTKFLDELQEIVKNNCIMDEKLKNVSHLMKDLINSLDDTEDSEKLMKLLEEKKEQMLQYKGDVSNHSNLREYCRQVKDILDNADGVDRPAIADDDIEMTQNDINIIDPFTKKRMTVPVKNKACGHVYDRESVNSLLAMNKNTRCPVVGCPIKNPILADNLISDIMTRRFLHDNPA